MFFTLNEVWLTGNTGTQSAYAIPSVAEFVALFDRFKLRKVNVKIVPSINTLNAFSTAIGTAPNTGLPIVQTAVDYDDSTAPTSAGDLLQRTDLKILRMDHQHDLPVVPRFTAVVADTAGSSAGSLQSGWLATSTAGQNVKHYGRKFWAEPLTGGPGVQQGTFVLYVDYEMEFQMPR